MGQFVFKPNVHSCSYQYTTQLCSLGEDIGDALKNRNFFDSEWLKETTESEQIWDGTFLLGESYKAIELSNEGKRGVALSVKERYTNSTGSVASWYPPEEWYHTESEQCCFCKVAEDARNFYRKNRKDDTFRRILGLAVCCDEDFPPICLKALETLLSIPHELCIIAHFKKCGEFLAYII